MERWATRHHVSPLQQQQQPLVAPAPVVGVWQPLGVARTVQPVGSHPSTPPAALGATITTVLTPTTPVRTIPGATSHHFALQTGMPPTVGRPVAAPPTIRQILLPAEGGWSLIRRASTSVFRTVATSGAAPRTFQCPFCLDNVRESERVVLTECGNVDHGVCRECMGGYIRSTVADGRTSVLCHQCRAVATPREVRDLTDDETLGKYERFQQLRQDHTVRECPSCGVLCKPTIDEDGGIVAEMTCGTCGSSFCYYHSNAHVGRPCEEYQREIARVERMLEKGLMRGTKACPCCGIRTEKTGGCNHMICERCGADWCWKCQKKLDDVTEHFWLAGPTGCRQFDDFDPTSPLAYFLRCLTAPVRILSSILFVLLFIPLSLTMVVWFPFFYICFVPCHRCSSSSEHIFVVIACSYVFTYAPFIVFEIVWAFFALLIWLILRPCGARRGHLMDLVQVPIASVASVIQCFLMWRACPLWLVGEDTSSDQDEEAGGDDDDE